MDERRWQQVVVEVRPEGAELVADHLWSAGAAGVEERADRDLVMLVAGFDDPAAAAAIADRLAAAGHRTAVVPITDDGLDAWRPYATATRAGRLWLVPAWVAAPEIAHDDALVWLDPGPTFGSGSHPTTRLVAAAVDRLCQPGQRMLDVGCGSGVLAVVAALAGATATAIDTDPSAPEATRANARRNGVDHAVEASTTPLTEVVGPFDLVAANLLAPVIVELGAELVRVTGTRGTLVVSGLLADRWEQVLPHLDPLEVVEVQTDDGWAAVTLRRVVPTTAQR